MNNQHADLSPQQKRALLENLLRQRASAAAEGEFPLSFAQERMLLLEQLAPGGAYHVAVAVSLEGPLNEEALRQAIRSLATRHESLRTCFPLVDGSWVQKVGSDAVDAVTALDVAGQDEQIDNLLRCEVHRPFDLNHGPCFRTTLFRQGNDRYTLLVCMHHIVSDGWSIGVLVRDLAALYESHLRGTSTDLPALPIQYRDYALWQREQLQGERLEAQLDYWRRQLADIGALELPLDHSRPPVETHRGATVSRAFPLSLLDELREHARGERATLFMALLAAFQALLWRYTGRADFAVGTPISGRTRAEVENLIGLFMNTLVLRTTLAEDASFRELLARVREVAVQAYEHQDVPLARLVEELRPERDLSRNPLFQVMFSLQDAPIMVPEFANLRVSPVPIDRQQTQVDLGLQVQKMPGNYLAMIEYNADLFESETVQRMLRHFQRLLEDIAADPDRPLADLRMMSESERRQVLVEWNATQAHYPKDECFAQLFEAQVDRTPNRVAAAFDDRTLTYAQLDERANQVARHLLELGVGRGDRVGLAIHRGLDMLAGLIGIMKAGSAYVPIDPDYPRGRIDLMLADSGIKALCTETALMAGLPAFDGPTVCLDGEELSRSSGAPRPVATAGPDDIAYVIYTSGSTGRPKGVQITGRSLVNFLWSMRQRPGLTESDVLLAVTSVSFDISCLELYLPLLAGARVVIAPDQGIDDGYRLAELLEACEATVMQATPATWKLLANAEWQGSDRLKVLCGGESLSRELAAFLVARSAEVWNLYGPTETTVWSTVERIRDDAGVVAVGRPIANTRIFTLDARQRPTPPGVAGEVYIGGDGVAAGYLNRPELTAERFVSGIPGLEWAGTLYRTGDLARFGPDGQLEHLGRLDHQIKVRGYRVEPGEVESALRSHPSVQDAVVVGRDSRLIAYVVHESGPAPTVSELRDYLSDGLPSYMVPALFVALESLPLTPNGKIDRDALPDPFDRSAAVTREFTPPETATERLIAGIWRDLLDIDQVGALDEFFDLGGHSLLAMQMVAKIEKETGSRMDLRDVFFRNLRQLAAGID